MDATDLSNCCKEGNIILDLGRFVRNISIEDEAEGHNPNVTRGPPSWQLASCISGAVPSLPFFQFK